MTGQQVSLGQVLIQARTIPARCAIGLVKVYQQVLSPLKPPSCKYYPSCSAYAVTALRRFGLIKGTGLALWRLARCNPWSLGGVDHVPERQGGESHHTAKHSAPSNGAMGAM